MEIEKSYIYRLRFLYGILCTVLVLFVLVLYQTQVVQGEAYYARSTTRIPTTETVRASRGVLTDRNGKLLVSNRQIYTITLDAAALPAGEENEAILRLVRLCQSYGVSWLDSLPIGQDAPFDWKTEGAGETAAAARSSLQKYLSAQGWSDTELSEETPFPAWSAGEKGEAAAKEQGEDFTGKAFLALLRKTFELGETYSPQEARQVAGVRYTLALQAMSGSTACVFAEDVPTELLSEVVDGRYVGVEIGTTSVRQYETEYAAHVLGYIGPIWADELAAYREQGYKMDALVGKAGAEKAFEPYLRGTDGKRAITTDEEGHVTEEVYSVEPEPGGTVALTIDIDFQAEVERILAEQVEAMTAEDGQVTRGAAAVVLKVDTGEALAIASYPTYKLSPYSPYIQDYDAVMDHPASPLFNRATNGTYAPGSTFKPLTAIAALENGTITTTERIQDRGIYTYYAPSYTPRCWVYPSNHGYVNVSQAIMHSCNYFFYDVGRRTGIEVLARYAKSFGLGQSTGIEIGDAAGVMDEPGYRTANGKLFMGGDTLQIAIGQGESLFTPLQLANYIATFVNGGTRRNVHLLKDVRSNDGSTLLMTYDEPPAEIIEMSNETFYAVKKGMGDLVTSGSVARYFRDCVVTAGAKTGSVQVGTAQANGTFVAFAPFEDPEIAVAVVVEKGESGSAMAALVVPIINAYFSASQAEGVTGEGTLLP